MRVFKVTALFAGGESVAHGAEPLATMLMWIVVREGVKLAVIVCCGWQVVASAFDMLIISRWNISVRQSQPHPSGWVIWGSLNKPLSLLVLS